MKSKKVLRALSLIGLLTGLGCSKEFKEKFSSEKLTLRGIIADVYDVSLDHRSSPENISGVNLALDFDSCQSCNRLDSAYHLNRSTLSVNLNTGQYLPSLKSGDSVRFTLNEGYSQTEKKDNNGRAFLYFNESPLNARLESYRPKGN